MRQQFSRAAIITFLVLVGFVALSQARLARAKPCIPANVAGSGVGRGAGRVPQTPCVREYFSEGPLYNPTFNYSNSSRRFRIPAMVWSALGKIVYAPSVLEKAAPATTTYWFLRVSETSTASRIQGSFVSSTSGIPESNEVLEYTVVSDKSGISSVAFPAPAQLLKVESADVPPSQSVELNSDTGRSPTAELVAQANVGALVGSNGTVLVNPSAVPAYASGQIAVGDYAGGSGLTGLFTAGTAGNIPNSGSGVLTFGNGTGTDNWTQIGASNGHDINGVRNTVIGILEVYGPSPFNEIGCAMDANANWGCGGGLFGNASATPLPNGPTPIPTTYPSPYGRPVVIAQATSAPTAQPGNVLVAGTSAARTHNACSASSGVPCGFTWSISSFSSGIGTTTVTVPASSVCVVTATQSPIVASGDVMTTWVTLAPFTPLTVHAQDLLGNYSGSFGGNGNCD